MLGTSRGPEARQRKGALEVSEFSMSVGSATACGVFCRYNGYLTAVRSKTAKRFSRGIADDDAPGGGNRRREARKPPPRVIMGQLPMPPRYDSTSPLSPACVYIYLFRSDSFYQVGAGRYR